MLSLDDVKDMVAIYNRTLEHGEARVILEIHPGDCRCHKCWEQFLLPRQGKAATQSDVRKDALAKAISIHCAEVIVELMDFTIRGEIDDESGITPKAILQEVIRAQARAFLKHDPI